MLPLSLISGHCHFADFQCRRRDPAAHVEIIADHLNVRQQLEWQAKADLEGKRIWGSMGMLFSL